MDCISDLKSIAVRTIITDVLILLISYVSQCYKLYGDIEIYADMVKSGVQSDIICAIRALDKEIAIHSYSFTHLQDVTLFPASSSKVNARHGMRDSNVSRRSY